MSASFVDNDGDTAMSTTSSSDNDNDNTPSPPPTQSHSLAQLATPNSSRNLSQQSRSATHGAGAGGPAGAAAALELTPPVSQPSFSPATGLTGAGPSATVFGQGLGAERNSIPRGIGGLGKEAEFTNIDEAVALAGDGNAPYAPPLPDRAAAAALSARRDEYEMAASKVVEGKTDMTRFGDLFDERHMSLKLKK